jgi:hypothetical protein
MRLVLIGAAAIALASCSNNVTPPETAAAPTEAAGSSALLTVADLPRIRAGQWEIRTTRENGEVEVTEQCVEGDQTIAASTASEDCPPTIRRIDGGFGIEGRCAADGYVSEVRATMRGDFQRRYVGEMKFTVSGGGGEVTHIDQRVEAIYQGPCTPGE